MTSALRRSHNLQSTLPLLHRSLYSTLTKPSHHNDHSKNHLYLTPTPLIGTFVTEQPPSTPKQALAKLAALRRDYARQVKEVRKTYIEEMEMQRVEKVRKDEARKQEILRQREERKKSKEIAAKARAAERQALDEEFRLALMKERAEKLEYWRQRQRAIEEKKNSKIELIKRSSSKWIKEEELEPQLIQAIVNGNSF